MTALLTGCGAPILVWHGHSPDRARRALLIEEEGGGQHLVVDGEVYPSWDAIAFTHLRWGPDGPIYPAMQRGRWHVVEGRTKGPAFQAIGDLIVAGGHIAYAAQDAEGWHVVFDGELGPALGILTEGSFLASEGGQRIVYLARAGEGVRRVRVVINGRVGPLFTRIEGLCFGDRGKRVAYLGFSPQRNDSERTEIVIDGEPQPVGGPVFELVLASASPAWAALIGGPLSSIRTYHPPGGARSIDAEVPPEEQDLTLSPDGTHLAARRVRPRSTEVVLGHERVGTHRAASRLQFVGPDNRLLYVAEEEEGERVIVGGEAGPLLGSVEELVVRPSGHWGYVGGVASGRVVVIDGLERYRGDWAGGLRLADRGGRWAVLVREGERRFVQRHGARFPIARPIVDTFRLDPEGRRFGLVVADPGRRSLEVQIDGQVVAPLDMDEVSAAVTQGRSPAQAMGAIVEGELELRRAERSR